MGFGIAPLMDTQVEALVSRFMAEHFPGCQFEGICEVTGHDLYTEYDVWVKDNPIIHKVVLTNNWSPSHASTDKVYLKKVILQSDVVLVPDEAWQDSEPIAYPDQVVRIENLCHVLGIELPDIRPQMTYREAQELIDSLVERIAFFRDGKRAFRCSSCGRLDMTDRDVSMPEHCYVCTDTLAPLADDPFLPME